MGEGPTPAFVLFSGSRQLSIAIARLGPYVFPAANGSMAGHPKWGTLQDWLVYRAMVRALV